MKLRQEQMKLRNCVTASLRSCLSLYSVDSLRALICYCFVNYCLLY